MISTICRSSAAPSESVVFHIVACQNQRCPWRRTLFLPCNNSLSLTFQFSAAFALSFLRYAILSLLQSPIYSCYLRSLYEKPTPFVRLTLSYSRLTTNSVLVSNARDSLLFVLSCFSSLFFCFFFVFHLSRITESLAAAAVSNAAYLFPASSAAAAFP